MSSDHERPLPLSGGDRKAFLKSERSAEMRELYHRMARELPRLPLIEGVQVDCFRCGRSAILSIDMATATSKTLVCQRCGFRLPPVNNKPVDEAQGQ